MKCPFCAYTESKVIDSRPAEEGATIRRRRECLACQKRFTTYEIIERLPLVVVKRDGSRQSFDKVKLINGMVRACEKRPVSLETLEKIADEIEQELKNQYPHLMRGASTGSAAKFVLTQFVGLNIFDNGDFACLQIPMSYDLGIEINLVNKSIIRRAHRRNIAVQYWTINDADDMRTLIELGCDCIMTDNPALLREVLAEYSRK